MREVEDNKMSRLFNDLFIFEMAKQSSGRCGTWKRHHP